MKVNSKSVSVFVMSAASMAFLASVGVVAVPPPSIEQHRALLLRQTSASDTPGGSATATEDTRTSTTVSLTSDTSTTSPTSTTTATTQETTTTPPSITPSSTLTPTISTPVSPIETPSVTVSQSVSTNADGGLVTVIRTVFNTQQTASSSTASPSPSAGSNDGSGVGTKSIAGMAIAGSLAVIGIGAFIWWKLSKKRFSGFSDDNEDAIKWPDLNDTTAMQPLPARPGGARDAEFDSSSQSELGQPNASHYYDNHSVMSSVADLSRPIEQAPSAPYYDVPPVQPGLPGYDQHAYVISSDTGGDKMSGYYDPYSGPVPQAFSPQVGAEYPADIGRQSPGPNAAFDAPPYAARSGSPAPGSQYGQRAASPGPSLGYGGGRSMSPGPNAAYGAYGARASSPGPNPAYGGGRVASPGPGSAYATGRAASPGPTMAYNGGRSASPGPNALG